MRLLRSATGALMHIARTPVGGSVLIRSLCGLARAREEALVPTTYDTLPDDLCVRCKQSLERLADRRWRAERVRKRRDP